jgi:serine protease AprX
VDEVQPNWPGFDVLFMSDAKAYTGTNYSLYTAQNFGRANGPNDVTSPINGDSDSNRASFSAADSVIAIVDSGIHGPHEMFHNGANNKIIGWQDFSTSACATACDGYGHGTHVASIAAGESNNASSSPNWGVAPGAALVGVKVFNNDGTVYIHPDQESSILKGLRWVRDHRTEFGIDVVNLSFGQDGCWASTMSHPYLTLIDDLLSAGVKVIVAAGNSRDTAPDDLLSRRCYFNYLTVRSGVVSVGAVADPSVSGDVVGTFTAGWSLAQFSSWGPTSDGYNRPKVSAPGVNILAAAAGTTNQYREDTGTSMAAPFVAGMVAAMLDANPTLTVNQVNNYLVDNAETMGNVNNNMYGVGGMVRVFDTYKAILSSTSTFDDGYSHARWQQTCLSTGGSKDYIVTIPSAYFVMTPTAVVNSFEETFRPTTRMQVFAESTPNNWYLVGNAIEAVDSVFNKRIYVWNGQGTRMKTTVTSVNSLGTTACHWMDIFYQ